MKKLILFLSILLISQFFIGCSSSVQPQQGATESQKTDMDIIEVYSEYKNASDPNSVQPIQKQLDMNILYIARTRFDLFEDGKLAGSLLGQKAEKIKENQYPALNEHCKLEAIYAREKVYAVSSKNFEQDIKVDANSAFFDAFYSEKKQDCVVAFLLKDLINPQENNYQVLFYPINNSQLREDIDNIEFINSQKVVLPLNEFEAKVKQLIKDKLTDHYDAFSLSKLKELGII